MNRIQRIDHFKRNLLHTAVATIMGSVALQAYGVTDESIKRPDTSEAEIITPIPESATKHTAKKGDFGTKDNPKSINLKGYKNLVSGLDGLQMGSFSDLDSGIENALEADSAGRTITIHGPALILSNSQSDSKGEPAQFLKRIFSDVTGTTYNPKSALIFQASTITLAESVGGAPRVEGGQEPVNYFASVDIPAASALHMRPDAEGIIRDNSIHAASISIKGEAYREGEEGKKEAIKLHPSYQPCIDKEGKPAVRIGDKSYYSISDDGSYDRESSRMTEDEIKTRWLRELELGGDKTIIVSVTQPLGKAPGGQHFDKLTISGTNNTLNVARYEGEGSAYEINIPEVQVTGDFKVSLAPPNLNPEHKANNELYVHTMNLTGKGETSAQYEIDGGKLQSSLAPIILHGEMVGEGSAAKPEPGTLTIGEGRKDRLFISSYGVKYAQTYLNGKASATIDPDQVIVSGGALEGD